MAVQDVPQPSRLVRRRPSVRVVFQIEDGLFEACVPSSRRGGVFGVGFFIESSEVTFGPGCNVNEIGHVQTRIR